MRDCCISLRLVLLLFHFHSLLRGACVRIFAIVEVKLVVPDSVLHHGCSVTRPGERLRKEQVCAAHCGCFVGHGTASMLDPESVMTALQGVHMMLGEALSRQLGPLRVLELLRHVGCSRRLLRLFHFIIINRLKLLYCDGLS